MTQGKRSHRHKHASGFSILEAMVSAGILGIGLLGLVKLHVTSMDGLSRSFQITTGAEVARQVAEEIASQQTEDSNLIRLYGRLAWVNLQLLELL